MSEETKEKIIKAEGFNETDKDPGHEGQASYRKPIYIAAGAILVVLLGAALFWVFRGRDGGQAVPAPRSTTFGESDQQTSGPAGDQTITIDPQQVERIGLKIEAVGETMSSEAANVASTGVVQPNAYNETPVISLVGGVVRRVDVELGQNVSKGQTLAIVFSDELASAQSRYLVLQTEAQTSRQNYERTAKLVRISPVSSGELDEALAKLKTAEAELEEHHKHHERTVKLLAIGAASREEYEQATSNLKGAEAEAEQARKRYDRAVKVAEINPVSRTEFEQAAVKLRTAEGELAAAKQRLILLGLSEQRVNALRSTSQISSETSLTAPVSGVITSRTINQGEVIEANKEVAKVTNLSNVWIIAQVYEKDLGRLRTGTGASVTTDAFPGELFRGQLTYIDPNINQETRTAQARIELENPGQRFRIGMYVNVAFGVTGTAEKTVPVIPSAAVQNINNQQIVFIATDSPNKFILRPVRLGTEAAGRYIVLEGLYVGDRIVTEGSFLLRAEWLKQHPAN